MSYFLTSVAANIDRYLHETDVKNAFLHGEFQEEIFMELLLGYYTSTSPGTMCGLVVTCLSWDPDIEL